MPNGIANSDWSNQRSQEVLMEIDEHKVDEISLALLYLTTFKDNW